MSANLLIVESPAKAKKLAGILSPEDGWLVVATYGHLMDLPSRKLGLGIANGQLKLYWKTTRNGRKQLSRLRTAVRTVRKSGGQIYVGTAPDREGETLAAHVMRILRLPEPTTPRVMFHSLDPAAVEHAIARPKRLDSGIVNSQEARRGLDRAVGYGLSRRLKKPISRVQAPILKACADQSAARRNFRPSTRYQAGFMVNTTFFGLPQDPMSTESAALRAAQSMPARRVVSRKQERKRVSPPPACTTTDVLKTFANEAGINCTIAAMQNLFVNALITFPKTDSRSLDQDWVEKVRSELGANAGMAQPPEAWTTTRAAMALEAIRPTSASTSTPGGHEDRDPLERDVYDYIARRAHGACSKQAIETVVTLSLDNRATATLIREDIDGWRHYELNHESGRPGLPDPILWPLQEGDPVEAVPSVQYLRAVPPDAPTVAWLLDWMEKNRVGRPSTYAPCVRKLIERELVVPHEREGLIPTQQGLELLSTLSGGGDPILSPKYTKFLEEWLDNIADQKAGPEEGAKLVQAGLRLAVGMGQSSPGL